ncbi:MAG: hypothetical protein ACM3S4_05980 [Burkholderiales bacterium]
MSKGAWQAEAKTGDDCEQRKEIKRARWAMKRDGGSVSKGAWQAEAKTGDDCEQRAFTKHELTVIKKLCLHTVTDNLNETYGYSFGYIL